MSRPFYIARFLMEIGDLAIFLPICRCTCWKYGAEPKFRIAPADRPDKLQEDKSMAFLTTTASALFLFSQLFMLLSQMAKLFGVFA